ncbi:MAG TPA: BON domain-containing protein [Casimicrobiaceae bacterium]|jgi:osmotically-inducible protein OsmY
MTSLRLTVASLALALGAGSVLSGCAPIVVAGAAAGTALVVADRRSAGAQLDDETIETKAAADANAQWGDRIHLNVTSFNGIVLLTGEAPDRATYDAIATLIKSIPRVRTVQDEMVIAPNTPMSSRTNDTYITSKVKTRFIEENRFPANRVKVVTERQVVYLMGMVTHKEGDDAAQIAAATSDVVRVVKVFEYIG